MIEYKYIVEVDYLGKRKFYFLLTNILVLLTIVIVVQITGVGHYIGSYGINFTGLLVFSAIIGFTGSFVSLAMSRIVVKRMMGVQLINPEVQSNHQEALYVEKV